MSRGEGVTGSLWVFDPEEIDRRMKALQGNPEFTELTARAEEVPLGSPEWTQIQSRRSTILENAMRETPDSD